jgi:hypothetical protein
MASNVDGSTPEPRSRTESSSTLPRATVRVSSRTAGGLVSLIQKRNAKGPAARRLVVSKTRS